jgi:phospholipid N-methyltransferase
LFLAVERDPVFAAGLRARHPGLAVHNESAEKLRDCLALHGKSRVDCIVSGLPWASLPLAVQDGIFEAIHATLVPGGPFTTFAYLHACWFPNARRLRERLERTFSRVEASRVVWRNVPPAFVYRCTR